VYSPAVRPTLLIYPQWDSDSAFITMDSVQTSSSYPYVQLRVIPSAFYEPPPRVVYWPWLLAALLFFVVVTRFSRVEVVK
jgi:hypothetical protein